ncbi:MAG: metallophosphoesterase [Sulfurimonas sp.]|nr:metallophosphoesterase [Sulfurimonas sp.]
MNCWEVLIVDDEAKVSLDLSSRYIKYKKLENYEHSGRRFNLNFAQSADDARQLLANSRYYLVLLDVRLREWGDNDSGEIFQELFTIANENNTVGLVSSLWETTSMEVVRRCLVRNPKISMPLFFTFRDFENEAFAAIASQIVTYVRRQRSQYELELPPGAPLRLLHLSDLHFGSDVATHSLAGVANVTTLCDKIKQCWPAIDGCPAGPDLVVVTGDVGNTGHPDDYVRALDWFRGFAAEFRWPLPTPRILIVPGNHDFSIPLCATHLLQLKEDKSLHISSPTEYSKKLAVYSMLPFSQFAAQISSKANTWDNFPLCAWLEFGFAEYGIAFSGFNTSKRNDDNAWPIRVIESEDIAIIREGFLNNPNVTNLSEIFHVALSHHSLIRYTGAREEVTNERECSEDLLGNTWSPQLLLHGHEHRRWGALPSGNDYMVVAAPSPTKTDTSDKNTTPCGLNLLELTRTDSIVSGVSGRSLVKLEAWQVLDLPGKNVWSR